MEILATPYSSFTLMKETILTEKIEEELYALLTEVAFLGALPKEKGHHQGFSAKECCKISAKKILDLLTNK